MANVQQNNPLHGITLEALLSQLVNRFGWEQLSVKLPINCFLNDPSLKSSLTFLRKTPWAREKLEEIYLASLQTATEGSDAPEAPRKILSRRLPATTSTVESAAPPAQEEATPIAVGDDSTEAAPQARPRISHKEKPRRTSSRDNRDSRDKRGAGKMERQGADGKSKRYGSKQSGQPTGSGRPQRERRPSAETNLLWRNDADPVEKERLLQQRYAEQLSKGSKSGKDKEKRPADKGNADHAKRPRRQPNAKTQAQGAGEGNKPASPWGKPGQKKRPRPQDDQA